MFNFENLLELTKQISVSSVIVLLFIFITTTLYSYRYCILLKYFNIKLSLIDSIKVTVIATLGSYLTPFISGSFAAKTMMVSRYSGCTKALSLGMVSYEKGFEVFWLASVSMIVLSLIPDWLPEKDVQYMIVVSLAILFIILMTIFLVNKLLPGIFYIVRFTPNKIQSFFLIRGVTKEKIIGILEKIKELVRNPKLFIGLLIPTIPSFFIPGLIVYIISKNLGGDLTFNQALIVYWIPNIFGKLSGIPGGVGSQDISMGFLLNYYGVDLITSAQIAAGYRFITMTYIFLSSGIVILSEGKDLLKSIKN